MIIGFGNGDFFKLYKNPLERFSSKFIKYFSVKGANAIELHGTDESMIDYLLNNKINLEHFIFVSLHAPSLPYADDEDSNRILSKLQLLKKKIKIDNFVFHPDKVVDWDVFDKYKDIPISIENMDDKKTFGRTVEDIKKVLSKYNFGLTLDLQHCFVNDKSMKLADDFQKYFKNVIVEYHISGYHEEFTHYSLFKTKQNKIIEALKFKEIPIIIESTFDEIGDQEKELKYIKNKIN